ncbi:DUF551 domain-containing protein [Escherichia coli]
MILVVWRFRGPVYNVTDWMRLPEPPQEVNHG